jgi:Na+-transporting NADH:ubiquinone oxidoreductase subunit NqrD
MIFNHKKKTVLLHSQLFSSEPQANSFVLKFLGSCSTFTATAQVITAMIWVKIYTWNMEVFNSDCGSYNMGCGSKCTAGTQKF